MSKTTTQVVIVGAGPVGLLTALRLGQAGVKTVVLEAHENILPAHRACVYMPVVIPALTKLGLIDEVKRQAYLNRDGITWRDVNGKALANLPLGDKSSGSFGGVLLLGQHKLAVLILEAIKKHASVEVRFGVRCVDIKQDKDSAQVTAHPRDSPDERITIDCDYVLGTDGANSAVRRLLNIDFEGFTYEGWKMIGSDILFDFIGEAGYSPLNFVVDPKDWAVVAYTGQDEAGGLSGTGTPEFRVAFTEPPNLPDSPEDYMQRAQERMLVWTKGKKNFKVLRAEPYVNKQRVAHRAIDGRIMLAGDALHSNNPIGGLGLTGGICDAFCYGNALVRVVKNQETPSLLTECATSRRQTWIDVTNKLSQGNITRLFSVDEQAVKEREQFFERLNSDPEFPAMVRGGLSKMMEKTFE